MNYIQENDSSIAYCTYLSEVFKYLELKPEDYDWHFSDVEVNSGWLDLGDPFWITGQQLASRLAKNNYQFFWAVISAFPKGTTPFTSEAPYADGNPDFWTGNAKKQLKESLFEIVCWDSCATLFIELPADLSKNLLRNSPAVKLLK